MLKLKEYIANLNYDYAETFSGLRGVLYQDFVLKTKEQILSLERRIEKARFMQRQTINKEIASLKSKLNLSNSRLIDIGGNKHQSAELVCKLKRDDINLVRICETLSIEYKSHSAWMCAPIFRDSIAFYKDKKIQGLIHICFGCESIINEEGKSFLADSEIYPILNKLFIELGHKITDEYIRSGDEFTS